jgi:hypothetical protein
MNLSKKLIYLVTFAVIFLLLPYGIYRFYINYQDGLYLSMQEFSSYTTLNGSYTVEVMDTKQFGSDETTDVKIYLINNNTDEVTYICHKKQKTYGSDITYKEDKSDDAFNVLVELSSGTVDINCLEPRGDYITELKKLI